MIFCFHQQKMSKYKTATADTLKRDENSFSSFQSFLQMKSFVYIRLDCCCLIYYTLPIQALASVQVTTLQPCWQGKPAASNRVRDNRTSRNNTTSSDSNEARCKKNPDEWPCLDRKDTKIFSLTWTLNVFYNPNHTALHCERYDLFKY